MSTRQNERLEMTQTTVYPPPISYRPTQPDFPSHSSSPSFPYLANPPAVYGHHDRPRHSKSPSSDRSQTYNSPASSSNRTTASSSPSMQKSTPSPAVVHSQHYPPAVMRRSTPLHAADESGQWANHSRVGTPQDVHLGTPSMTTTNSAIYRYIQEDETLPEDDHAIRVLLFLLFLDPPFSLFSAIYTIVLTLMLLLVSPLRFCRPSFSLSDSIIRLLAPMFRVHLNAISAPSAEEAYTFRFRPVLLVLVQVAAPFLSIGVAFAAWTAAAFWLFALMMGNPDGTERRDDGRAAVLTVRDWWERFLLYSIK